MNLVHQVRQRHAIFRWSHSPIQQRSDRLEESEDQKAISG